jgi:hypothetical protein
VARIRSLKPDIWHSHDICQLTVLGRLVWVILITQADDEGRMHIDAHHLAKTYLQDGHLTSAVQSQLVRMQSTRMLTMYKDVSTQPVVALHNFPSHQKISHPTPSRIQKPPEFPESSRALRNPPERSPLIDKKDEIDKKDGYISAVENGSALAVLAIDPIIEVFQAWKTSTGRGERTVLGAKRHRVIEQALKIYPASDVLLAVDGWRHSPHHRGENDRGVKYNDLELLLRDEKHIEMFRDLALAGPTTTAIPFKPSISHAYREQAAKLREAGV